MLGDDAVLEYRDPDSHSPWCGGSVRLLSRTMTRSTASRRARTRPRTGSADGGVYVRGRCAAASTLASGWGGSADRPGSRAGRSAFSFLARTGAPISMRRCWADRRHLGVVAGDVRRDRTTAAPATSGGDSATSPLPPSSNTAVSSDSSSSPSSLHTVRSRPGPSAESSLAAFAIGC